MSTSSVTRHLLSGGILHPFARRPTDLQIEHVGSFRGPFLLALTTVDFADSIIGTLPLRCKLFASTFPI